MTKNKFLLPTKVLLLFSILSLSISCSKDSDLLAEQVLFEPIAEVNTYVIPDDFQVSTNNDSSEDIIEVEVSAKDGISYNDSYEVSTFEGIKLDVLANDDFDKPESAVIISTSQPDKGTVDINSDNTLLYIPSSFETYEDTFTYTVEFENNDGSSATETAEVSVKMNPPATESTTAREFPEPDYYVTPSGSADNDGLTEATAWSLEHAFKSANSGDVVYIKAGTYSKLYSVNISGSNSNPIVFIGYLSAPGDIDESSETSLSKGTITVGRPNRLWYGDSPSPSNMPYFSRSIASSGTLLNVNGSYLHFYNMQFRGGEIAINNEGNYNEFKNIFAFKQTDNSNPSSPPYFGKSILNYGNNTEWKNIYVEDSGAQGFTNYGDNNTFDNIAVVCSNTSNPTDYYYYFASGVNNNSTDIYVLRSGNLSHGGHGIVYKANADIPAMNNLVSNFIIDNTNLEPQFPGTHDNLFKNGYIENSGTNWKIAGMRIANNSYQNTFDNIYLKNCIIKFADWNDGRSGEGPNNSNGSASHSNTFNQITVDGGRYAVSFNAFDGLYNGSTYDNTFYNCTFYKVSYLFEISRDNSNSQFINCVFDNIDGLHDKKSDSPGYPADAYFRNSNFSNVGFAVPEGDNITTLNPQFVNPSNLNFSVGSNLSGTGLSTPFLSSGNDLGSIQN